MLYDEPKHEEIKLKKSFFVILIVLDLIVSLLAGSVAGIILVWSNDDFNFNGNKIAQEISVQEESATTQVVERVRPSVVSISIYKEPQQMYNFTGPSIFDDFFKEFGLPFENQPQNNTQQKSEPQRVGGGTGFIITADGLILTNKHVVSDEQASYKVTTDDGQTYDAKVLARDTINDLAMIKIEAKNLTPVELGNSDDLKIGQTVVAIGNALAEYDNTVTKGVISGIGRRIEAGDSSGASEVLEELIQTDTAINPGNSGGPLVNLDGQVIGINTAINQQAQSIGFAIPINQAKEVINSVEQYGKIIRPYLGVRYIMINDKIAKSNNLEINHGALIVRGQQADALAVVPGSPADKAGLVENDIILEIGGQTLDDEHSLVNAIAKYKVGDEIELKIWHKGETKTVKVKLEERR